MSQFVSLLREAHAVTIAVQAGDRNVSEICSRTGLSVAKVSSWASVLRLPLEPNWQRGRGLFSAIALMPLARPQ